MHSPSLSSINTIELIWYLCWEKGFSPSNKGLSGSFFLESLNEMYSQCHKPALAQFLTENRLMDSMMLLKRLQENKHTQNSYGAQLPAVGAIDFWSDGISPCCKQLPPWFHWDRHCPHIHDTEIPMQIVSHFFWCWRAIQLWTAFVLTLERLCETYCLTFLKIWLWWWWWWCACTHMCPCDMCMLVQIYTYHSACVETKDKFWELVLPLCCGFLELNSDYQDFVARDFTGWVISLPAQTSVF